MLHRLLSVRQLGEVAICPATEGDLCSKCAGNQQLTVMRGTWLEGKKVPILSLAVSPLKTGTSSFLAASVQVLGVGRMLFEQSTERARVERIQYVAFVRIFRYM